MTCLLLPIYQVTITLNICTTLATAMGAQINRHLKVLGTGIFSTLADAKVTVLVFFFRRCSDVLTFLLRLPSLGITITTQLFYLKHVTSKKALYLISFTLGLLQVRASITFSISGCLCLKAKPVDLRQWNLSIWNVLLTVLSFLLEHSQSHWDRCFKCLAQRNRVDAFHWGRSHLWSSQYWKP